MNDDARLNRRSREMETWKPTPCSPYYEISDLGRVRRIETGNFLTPHCRADGKLVVTMTTMHKATTRTVHSLVAEAFMGPRARTDVVSFLDKNPRNCSAQNLRYVSRSIGVPKGPPEPAQLTPVDVQRIRYLLEHNVSGRIIAGTFGVSSSVISRIKTGKIWTQESSNR